MEFKRSGAKFLMPFRVTLGQTAMGKVERLQCGEYFHDHLQALFVSVELGKNQLAPGGGGLHRGDPPVGLIEGVAIAGEDDLVLGSEFGEFFQGIFVERSQ